MGHLPSLLSCFMRTLKNLGNIVLKKVAQILLYSKHSTFVLFAKFVVCIYNGSLTHYQWGWDLIQKKKEKKRTAHSLIGKLVCIIVTY